MNAARRLLALPPGERLLVLEALFFVTVARLALFSVPFKRIVRFLGQEVPPGSSADTSVPASAANEVRLLGAAIDRVSRHTPWETACLAQAAAGKFMLRRRGLPSRLYLGTRRDEQGRLQAHAWLETGGQFIVGGAGSHTFTPLGSFHDPPPGKTGS